MIDVIDLFAGAGGFSLGAHRVTDSVVGIELDGDACATQRAAGMHVCKMDVREMTPGGPRGGKPLHLHASPPCTTLSAAGKGEGRSHLDLLSWAALEMLRYGHVRCDLTGVPEGSQLVLEPARWIHELMPDTISLGQVRAVLPIWEAYKRGLEMMGYRVWTGLLHAEQYGVPQSRVRAWLMASKRRPVSPPRPTHSKYHPRNPTKLDEGVLPWVSMAEALGFAMTARPAYTVTAGGTDTGGAELFGNGARKGMRREEEEGRWTHYAPDLELRMTRNPNSARRPASAPASTIMLGNAYNDAQWETPGENLGWEHRRPSTTVCGDPRLSGPGRNDPNVSGSQYGKNARKITVAEAGILQGFPADYPWQGTRTSQFKQAGNAVPPPVAEAVLRSLL